MIAKIITNAEYKNLECKGLARKSGDNIEVYSDGEWTTAAITDPDPEPAPMPAPKPKVLTTSRAIEKKADYSLLWAAGLTVVAIIAAVFSRRK